MSEELFEMYLENLNTSIKLIDVIIPAIKKFEGKVYNRRFDNAINQAILRHYGGDKSKTVCFSSIVSSDIVKARFIFDNNRYWIEPRTCVCDYMPYDYIDIYILDEKSETVGKTIRYVSYDENWNKVLNASLLVEALEEQKAVLQEKISELKAHALKVEEYKQREAIPREIVTFFNLEVVK